MSLINVARCFEHVMSLREGTLAGEVLLRGRSVKANVNFYLHEDSQPRFAHLDFSVDRYSGEVKLKRTLDWSRALAYHLYVVEERFSEQPCGAVREVLVRVIKGSNRQPLILRQFANQIGSSWREEEEDGVLEWRAMVYDRDGDLVNGVVRSVRGGEGVSLTSARYGKHLTVLRVRSVRLANVSVEISDDHGHRFSHPLRLSRHGLVSAYVCGSVGKV